MNQLSIFDPAAATAARNQAIERVADGASVDHRAACETALDAVIQRGQAFTTDDVIAALGATYDDIREPRLLGAVMMAARRAGRIRATGRFIPSARPANHRRDVRWVVNAGEAGQGAEDAPTQGALL